MKKFLIATTALTLSAGVAAAEVKLSGDARLGLQYNSDPSRWVMSLPTAFRPAPASGTALATPAGNGSADANWGATPGPGPDGVYGTADDESVGSKTKLEKRVTVNIDASTTADNGVTFGARIRIRSDEVAGTAIAGARVFARAGGLTVAGGNILGAIESMPGVYAPSVGLTGLGWAGLVTNVTGRHFDWDAYSSRGNGAEGIEVIYTMGDFTGHLSYSSNKLRGAGGATVDTISAYGAYNFQGWTVALGFADSDAVLNNALVSATPIAGVSDKIVLTVGGKIGDFGVGFGAARNGKGVSKVNKFALNGSYTMGATTISGYVATESGHSAALSALMTAGNFSKTSYGLGASYDLGGGASVVGGIERTTAKTTRADLGVSFRF